MIGSVLFFFCLMAFVLFVWFNLFFSLVSDWAGVFALPTLIPFCNTCAF